MTLFLNPKTFPTDVSYGLEACLPRLDCFCSGCIVFLSVDDATEGVVEEKEGGVRKLEPIELINNPPGRYMRAC